MTTKDQKKLNKELVNAAKRISQLEEQLKQREKKLKQERKRSKSLSDKLTRSHSTKLALKEEVSILKKNF